MTIQATRSDDTSKPAILYMALELSAAKWMVLFGDGRRRSGVPVTGGDVPALLAAIAAAKSKFKLAGDCRVVGCYEAGRDGFWLHWALIAAGVESQVVDSSAIEVSRKKRRAKTDRIDSEKLLALLIRQQSGEARALCVVRAPDEIAEDKRQIGRELERLKHDRTRIKNLITSLLFAQGVRNPPVGGKALQKWLGEVRDRKSVV